MLAFDNETFLITRERPFPPVVCLSWASDGRSAVIPHTGAEAFMRAQLEDAEQRFVGLNVAYDAGTLAASYPSLLPLIFDAYKAGRVTDVGIRQQLFDIATGRVQADDRVRAYGLAALYELIFERPMPGPGKGADSFRLRYGELYDVDFADWPDAAIDYSRMDAVSTLEIYDEQQKVAGLLRDDAFQTYSAFCLSLTSAQGMRTNADRVAQFKREQLAVMEALQPELVAAGMLEPEYKGRGDAKHQVGWTKKMLPAREHIAKTCADAGVEPMLTKSGESAKRDKKPVTLAHLSIDRTACVWARDALLLRRCDYVAAANNISTYLPFLEAGVHGPVTSRFNLAATGRTTSSAPREPAFGSNMQNAPRVCKRIIPDTFTWENPDWVSLEPSPVGVRECFEPRPGRIFLSGDLAGAELHAVAQICRWRFGGSVLGDTMAAGLDAHLVLACYLLGGDRTIYDDVSVRYKQDDPDVVAARQNAKPGNFGFWGAMGVPTFIKTQLKEGKRWSKAEAQALKSAWLSAWPEAQQYFDSNKQELGPKGSATVEFYWSKRLRKVKGLATICNGYFQALVADGTKKAINEVIRCCYVPVEVDGHAMTNTSALYLNSTRPVNFIHDELILETDDKTDDPTVMGYVVEEFVGTMEREFNELLPDYPTTVDPVLSYMLSKRAKTVRNPEGHLIPWTG